MGVQLQPIRNLDVVFEVARKLRALETDQGKRMYMLWIVGINMGMRIGPAREDRIHLSAPQAGAQEPIQEDHNPDPGRRAAGRGRTVPGQTGRRLAVPQPEDPSDPGRKVSETQKAR